MDVAQPRVVASHSTPATAPLAHLPARCHLALSGCALVQQKQSVAAEQKKQALTPHTASNLLRSLPFCPSRPCFGGGEGGGGTAPSGVRLAPSTAGWHHPMKSYTRQQSMTAHTVFCLLTAPHNSWRKLELAAGAGARQHAAPVQFACSSGPSVRVALSLVGSGGESSCNQAH